MYIEVICNSIKKPNSNENINLKKEVLMNDTIVIERHKSSMILNIVYVIPVIYRKLRIGTEFKGTCGNFVVYFF